MARTFTNSTLEIDADLTGIIDELEEDIQDTVIKRLALGIFTGVQKWSPVATGRFRSGWAVEFNSPSSSRVTNDNKSPKGNIDAQAEQRALAKINAFDINTVTSINITNNLPYSRRLATGWSTQAPDGSLDMVVREEVEKIK